ncbi:MAG: YraN family protein [Bacteroides sp.]|nr:YraN family protein [Bacteroides sp.]
MSGHSQNKTPASSKVNAEKRGHIAEDVAATYLLQQGYLIRERNWKNSKGKNEVDIIAQHGDEIIFVEVKCRTGEGDDPVAAVNARKMMKMTKAADSYLRSLPQKLFYRFDIIAFHGNPVPENIQHFRDAFIAPITTGK